MKMIKRSLMIAGAAAIVVATPVTVAAHSNRGDDNNHGRSNKTSHRSDDNRRWWKPWHKDEDKPKPAVDPAKCAEWQTRLNEWVANYKATASKDILFGTDYSAMVQNFVTNQNLTPADYQALIAKVETEKAEATSAVDAMTPPDLNCENDPAETTERGIDRSSMKDAKRAMEEYKHALKELTESVRASYGGQGMM